MPKILMRAWNIVTGILVAAVVLLAILIAGVRVVGIQPYAVLSGSMEPTYHVGSMIYIKAVPATELRAGDPVTFYLSGSSTVATHRIIEILPDPDDAEARYFRTQGDANDVPDANLLHSSKVIGKPLFNIPYLGYFSTFIQRQPGRSIALGVCTILLIAAILPGVWFKKPTEKKSDDPAGDQEPIAEEMQEAIPTEMQETSPAEEQVSDPAKEQETDENN
ncbi:MAG: signal peptidase I [Clostridia bacterium]|nr:signal peptidase I [Clostridia bacterium]